MRVCDAHRDKSIHTLKSLRDDAEYDFCPVCWEAMQLVLSGEMFTSPDDHPAGSNKRRGRPPKGE